LQFIAVFIAVALLLLFLRAEARQFQIALGR